MSLVVKSPRTYTRAHTRAKPGQSSPGDLAVEIRILITTIAKLTMRDLEQRIGAVLPGLSLLQYGILRMLSQEPRTLSELSTLMILTPSTLVPAVDKLEREGLVVRGKDPSDRRRTPLILTDAAQRALKTIPSSHPDDLIVRAVSQMEIEHAQQLRTRLHELLMSMSDDRTLIEEMLANHPDWKCMRQ